jgi:hypothetical protein
MFASTCMQPGSAATVQHRPSSCNQYTAVSCSAHLDSKHLVPPAAQGIFSCVVQHGSMPAVVVSVCCLLLCVLLFLVADLMLLWLPVSPSPQVPFEAGQCHSSSAINLHITTP